jgi:chromosomal replication initiator protein
LITVIQPPDLETRIAILQKKSESEHIKIPDNILVYIANQVHSNIRELEGALNRVTAYAMLNQTPITMDLCVEALQSIFLNQPKIITMELILEKVAQHTHKSIEEFKAKKRSNDIAYARQIAMYLCREFTDQSFPEIGDFFGGRHHTTAMYAHDEISKKIQTEPETNLLVQKILGDIKKQ